MATHLTNRHWLLRDVSRLGVPSVCALAGFALLAYGFQSPAIMRIVGTALRPAAVPAAAPGNDPDIYTGSILFVPRGGELCGQWMFDNRNGALWDNGQVNCRTSSEASKQTEGMSTARMMAIGKAFKGN